MQGKMPALIRPDGSTLYESEVLVQVSFAPENAHCYY
jgi:hypothetical protein